MMAVKLSGNYTRGKTVLHLALLPNSLN